MGFHAHGRHTPDGRSEIILVYVVCQGKRLSGGGMSSCLVWHCLRGWVYYDFMAFTRLSKLKPLLVRVQTAYLEEELVAEQVAVFSQDDFYKESKGKTLLHSCNRL